MLLFVTFEVFVEDATKVTILSEKPREFILQPGEDTGKKILTVRGISDHSETK